MPDHAVDFPNAPRQRGRATLLWLAVVSGALLAGGAVATLWLRGQAPDAIAVGRTATDARAETVVPAMDSAPDVAATGAAEAAAPLDLDQLRQVVSVLSAEDRGKVLAEDDAFVQFVAREALRRSTLAAARDANLDENERVRYLMRRGSDQVLVDAYLAVRTRGALDAGFPSEAQVREFYDTNKARFETPERVPLWQIFFALPEDADAEAVGAAQAKAREVAAAVRSGELGFESAVAAHSQHPASRALGGFMGTPTMASLLPEVRAVLPILEEGILSEPIRSASGVHLVRRGAVMPVQMRPFESVREQIATELRRAAEARLRQEVLSEVHEARGQALSREQTRAWREALAAEALQ